jgi:hypothetical protein
MYGTPLMSQMNAVSAGGLLQGGAGLYGSMGARLFEPESQYNAQMITANRQEAMQAQMANAQSSAGLTSGLMGMAGAVGGAFLGNPALGSMLGSSLGGSIAGATTTPAQANFTSNLGNTKSSFLGNYNMGYRNQ